ncbi:MAG: hypothetical protein QM764_07045 [Chitinophagaceae bacterium]
MKIVDFFKNHLTSIWSLSLAIFVLLSDFIIPPNIDLNTAEGEIDYVMLSKFIVCGIVLVLIVPFYIYNKKRHVRIWLILSVSFLIISLGLLLVYFDIRNEVTTYDRYKQKRFVSGNTLLPIVQKAVDSLKSIDNRILSRQAILESAGSPGDIWPFIEIERNSRRLLLVYVTTFACFSLFLLFGLQSTYCVTREDSVI